MFGSLQLDATHGVCAEPGFVPQAAPFEAAAAIEDRWLFRAACLLLATYFYEIPVIRLPYGMLTWLRLDDLAMIPLVLAAVISGPLPSGIGSTHLGLLIKLTIVLMPVSIMITAATTSDPEAIQRGAWTMTKYIEYFIVFVIVSRLRINRRRLTILVTIALLGSLLNAAVGIAQYFGLISPASLYGIYLSYEDFGAGGGIQAAHTGVWNRALGLFTSNYVLMGTFMYFGLGFVVLAVAAGLGQKLKALALTASAPIAAGLVLSGSRSSLGVAAAFFAVYSALGKRRPLAIAIFVFALIAGAVALKCDVRGEVTGRIGETQAEWEKGGGATGGGRIRLYRDVMGYMLSQPVSVLVGTGMSSFQYVYRDLFGAWNPHNNYLLVLAELGIGGLMLWTAIQVLLLSLLVKMRRQTPSPHVQVVGSVLLALHIGLLGACLVDMPLAVRYSMGSFLGFYQFWLAAGFAMYRDSLCAQQAS